MSAWYPQCLYHARPQVGTCGSCILGTSGGKIFLYLHLLLTLIEATVIELNILFIVDNMS